VLREQSLGTTLALGFVCLLSLLAAVIAYTIHEVNATELQRRLLLRELLPAAAASNQIALAALRYESSLLAFSSSRQPGDLETARQSEDRLRAALLDLQRVKLADRDLAYQLGQLQTAARDLETQARGASDYAARAGPGALAVFIQRYVRGTVEATVETAERLVDQLDHRAVAIRGHISRRGDRLRRSLVWTFGVTGLIGLLLAVFCVRLVTEPVGRLSLAARAVERGDYSLALRLNEPAAGKRRDGSQNELTVLTGGFLHMAGALEERENRLRSQAEHLLATNSQLEALQALTDVALSDLPADPLIDQLLERLIAGIGGSAGAVYLDNRDTGRLELRSLVCLSASGGEVRAPEWAADLARHVAENGKLVVCEDARHDSDAAPLAGEGVGSYLAAPIRHREEVTGAALVAFADPTTFTPTAVNLVQVFAERLERALDRARAVEELDTRRRELERQVAQQQQQLLRQERMAAIGLLGGSIAHELRNPLGVISNAVYFLKHHTRSQDEKSLLHLGIIEREVRHSVRIINNLVDFSLGVDPATTRLDLNELIRTSLEYTPVPAGVTVDLTLAADLAGVVGDESQLLQVIDQVVRNAVQAMEGAGRLQIGTGADGDRVWARFEDSGPGVSAEDQGQIFEPLMTTRAKGMGLGLALSRKILEAHGGQIRLVSQPGEGAVFLVEMPLAEKPPSPAAGAPLAMVDPQGE